MKPFAIVNGADYALTGGLFSRSPAALETRPSRVVRRHLYSIAESPGAVVERHPFGGFKMSAAANGSCGAGISPELSVLHERWPEKPAPRL